MNLLLALILATTTVPLDTATFAGGCFWSMERAFDQVAGVLSVTAGYTGGNTPHPSYEQVSRSEEHTSELQSQSNLVCRLLLEKKKKKRKENILIIQRDTRVITR